MAHRFLDPFPKYLQIREILTRRIAREMRVGDRLPTEQELCKQFGVSRETIRDAWRGLEEDGLISRARGQGTFVARLPPAGRETRLTGLSEDLTRFKMDTEASVLAKGPVVPQPSVAQLMATPPDEMVYRIFRLRFVERQPFALHEAFLPLEVGARVGRRDLCSVSIVNVLRQSVRSRIWEDHHRIEALASDTEVAQHLGVGIGSPILYIVRHFKIADDQPIALFRSHYRADRYFYTVRLGQMPPGPRPRRGTATARGKRVPGTIGNANATPRGARRDQALFD